MATDAAVARVLVLFAGAYPIINRDPDDVKRARLSVLQMTLRDVDDDVLQAAVIALIGERVSEYPPSPGAIRQRAMQMRERAAGEDEIDEYEAWGMVQQVIGALGGQSSTDEIRAYLTRKHGDYKGGIVTDAIARFGWRDLCYGDNENDGVRRAQFRDTVKALQARSREDRRMQPQVRDVLARLAQSLDANTPRQLEGKR